MRNGTIIFKEDFGEELEQIYLEFKNLKIEEVSIYITNSFNNLIKENQRFSYNTIYNFIIGKYYAERQTIESFVIVLKDIELENPRKQLLFNKFRDYCNLEISRFIEKDKIKEQEKELKIVKENYRSLIKALNEKLETLNKSIEETDKKSLEKLGLFIAIFSLIAGNISILYKGTELKPEIFVSIIFLINGIIILSMQTLFKIIGTKFSNWYLLIPICLNIIGITLFLLSMCNNII